MHEDVLVELERRLGGLHAKQRLGIERDHEAQIFGQGLTFFHLENWYSIHSVIRGVLKLTGLYSRARRNAERVLLKRNEIRCEDLPPRFDGFTILHISDMHVDMNEIAMQRLIELVGDLHYDLSDHSRPPWREYGACAITSRARSMECSAIMTPFRWFRRLKRWE
jgi:hypothetical protein